jgi:glucose/arabinose dehydrogenase
MNRYEQSIQRAIVSMAVAVGAVGCLADDVELDELEAALASPTTFVSDQSRRCLDVPGGRDAPQTGLEIYRCHGDRNQRFRFGDNGQLLAIDDTRCVEPAAVTTPRRQAVIAPCTGQAFQRWEQRSDGTIVHVQTGLCLDVEGERTTDQTHVNLWSCHGRANQRWLTDSQAPTPPSGLSVRDLTCTSATLSWTGSTDNVGVAFYDVYHDGQFMKTVAGDVRSTGLTLVPGAVWGLYVNARDVAGNVSQASTTLPVNVPFCQADTEAPTTPQNLSGTASGTSISLQWSASTDNVGVRFYDVHRDGARVGTVPGSGSSPPAAFFVDSGLAAETSYRYHVFARDAQGNTSPGSAIVTVRTGAACSTPICSITEVTRDTDIPWGLVTLADGTILYGQRDAQDIIHLDPSTGVKRVAGRVPNVQSTDGEGGLLGLAIGPDFESDRWLYIMHTSPDDNRIVRIQYRSGALDTGTLQLLVTGIRRNKFHNAGRLRFGPDGTLYAGAGDAQNGAFAQDINNLSGKVLRLNPDGSVPSDNPFGNHVWSYGHRNPQGLAFDSQGRLWTQEFGDGSQDETNLIRRGGNYGWPACEGTVSRSGTGCATPGFIAPKQTYSTADASCSGLAIVRDAIYIACLRGTRLYRASINGESMTNLQQFFVGTYGRLRTVEPTIDGNLWLTTSTRGDKDSIPNNSDEKIFRVFLR